MQLSLANINEHSPYRVYEEGGDSVRFITDCGVVYELSFVEDYSLGLENVFQLCIDNVNNNTQPQDSKVRDTVVCVVEEFFRDNSLCLLYICDSSDGRQEARHRIFSMWYLKRNEDRFTLIPASMNVDDTEYFASIIISKSHPNYQVVVDSFDSLIKSLSDKWN